MSILKINCNVNFKNQLQCQFQKSIAMSISKSNCNVNFKNQLQCQFQKSN
jgi:hypothetical protein